MINPVVKPYCSCLHPVIIKNRYTGDPIYVECGECEVCLSNKAIQKELRCNIQLASSRCCFFVTLTYATEHIPVARFYKLNGSYHLCCVPRDHVYTYVTSQGYNRKMSFCDEAEDHTRCVSELPKRHALPTSCPNTWASRSESKKNKIWKCGRNVLGPYSPTVYV